jgi:hypothetical protein
LAAFGIAERKAPGGASRGAESGNEKEQRRGSH